MDLCTITGAAYWFDCFHGKSRTEPAYNYQPEVTGESNEKPGRMTDLRGENRTRDLSNMKHTATRSSDYGIQ
jgi:hypothetical protein